MAARTETLLVAALAQLASARGNHPMLPQEVAVVHQVRSRARALLRQINVTAIAVANFKLVAMLMASKTHRHRRSQFVLVLSHADVTASAIALRQTQVLLMREDEVLLCLCDAGRRNGRAVASDAIPGVVRRFVAPDAGRRSR